MKPRQAMLYSILMFYLSFTPLAQAQTIDWYNLPQFFYTGNIFYGHLLGYPIEFVGRDLNGTGLNGTVLNGKQIVSVSYQGATLAGELLETMALRETRFTVNGKNGLAKGKNDLVGAEFVASLDNGDTLLLRIEDVYQHPDKEHRDIYLYNITYSTSEGRRSLCGYDDQGQIIPAIPLEGKWDYSQGTAQGGSKIQDNTAFTFGCVDYVLAKCVLAGYKPWAIAQVCQKKEGCQKITLEAFHQTCTRMLRADYCGDGRAHTEEHLLINVYDAFGIRIDNDDWNVEAEWDPNGAVCVRNSRAGHNIPGCATSRFKYDCGNRDHFYTGTLLITETAP